MRMHHRTASFRAVPPRGAKAQGAMPMNADLLDIGQRRQLFIDPYLTKCSDGAGLRLHRPLIPARFSYQVL